ncbi:hypothetical protein BX070DRAFT_196549 [Coemansia spiralis]|nr:hypothetical protein BX070DRAFT_196549 [Coemansia spiralis]
MFAVRVGKGSRARNNEELREFFETRDDEDDDDAFDAIDDDDLDVSGYESEDDGDETTSFPPVPIDISCPFCAAKTQECTAITSASDLTKHLRDNHGLVFKNLNHMALLLQRYLDAWAQNLETAKIADVAAKEEAADKSIVYHVDAEKCAEDKKIRDRVQKENLDGILAIQEMERRNEAQEPRKCLFCKYTCSNRAELFRHGYREHNFNIGLPDNLVNVNEFLHILESKLQGLQCLYCEKTFTSAAVLRKHMRKKKHFKISSHNRLYDRFYVINYVQPGKSWEAIENENDDSDADEADRKDDSWTDWDDKADLPARSLFDDHVAASADECWEYMQREFGFDIKVLREKHKLDFYKTVAFINMIRQKAAQSTCFACGEDFSEKQQLAAHIKQSGREHFKVPADGADVWENKEYLKPAIEGDPLLMGFDDDGDEDADEETSRKRLEESKKILRKKFDQMTIETSGERDEAGGAAAAPVVAATSS